MVPVTRANRSVASPVVAAVMVVSGSASAQDALSVEVRERSVDGGQPPALLIDVHQPLAEVRVRLDGPGLRVRRTFQGVDAGTRLEVTVLPRTPGRIEVEGELTAAFPDGGTGTMPLRFAVERTRPLDFSVQATPDGVSKGFVHVRANDGRKLSRFEVALIGARERVLGSAAGEVAKDGRVSWPAVDDTVIAVELEVHAEDGAFRRVSLYPWRLDVAHEEVRFPTGSAEIQRSEEPKLTASVEAIRAALADVRPWADAKLFVLGHTDRVGDGAANLALSARRSRAIGAWFRRAGLQVPILTAGVGEERQAVQTADGVDEARNRRVEYIIAVEAPELPMGRRWRPLGE